MKIPKNLLPFFIVASITISGVVGPVYWIVSQKPTPLCPRCNIVMIDIDILRADALPCYGYKRNTAPNICAFAQKGQLFLNNFAQATWTLPSMISTITSLYPSTHGVTRPSQDVLDLKVPTLAQTLRTAGYKTFFYGPNEVVVATDSNGGTKGYDVVQMINSKDLPRSLLSLAQLNRPFFVHFYTSRLHGPYLLENERQLIEPGRRPKDFPVTKDDLSRIIGPYIQKNYDKFFTPLAIKERPSLFTSMTASNIPPLLDYYRFLSHSGDPKKIINRGGAEVETYLLAIKNNERLSAPYARLLYDSVLSLLDQELEQVLLLLSSQAFSRNTIVVLYSDHGEGFGEHGFYAHPEILYNEIIKTPLILRVPGIQSKIYTGASQNIDIFPTLISLVGLGLPGGLQGISLLPILKTQTQLPSALAISQTNTNKVAISDGLWKLIINDKKQNLEHAELYNMTDDPSEKNNLITVSLGVGRILLNEYLKRIPARLSTTKSTDK